MKQVSSTFSDAMDKRGQTLKDAMDTSMTLNYENITDSMMTSPRPLPEQKAYFHNPKDYQNKPLTTVYLNLSSAARDGGTVAEPVFKLSPSLQGVVMIEVMGAYMPVVMTLGDAFPRHKYLIHCREIAGLGLTTTYTSTTTGSITRPSFEIACLENLISDTTNFSMSNYRTYPKFEFDGISIDTLRFSMRRDIDFPAILTEGTVRGPYSWNIILKITIKYR